MNPAINDQSEPLSEINTSRYCDPPILLIGNISKDLSNLCLVETSPSKTKNQSTAPAQLRRQSSSALEQLQRYPCSDELSEASQSQVSVDELFNQVPQIVQTTSGKEGATNSKAISGSRIRDSSSGGTSEQLPAESTRIRGSSIDIDRSDDWIVEPLDLAGKDNKGLNHQQHTESTVEETHTASEGSAVAWGLDYTPQPLSRFPSRELLSLVRPPPPPPPLDYYPVEPDPVPTAPVITSPSPVPPSPQSTGNSSWLNPNPNQVIPTSFEGECFSYPHNEHPTNRTFNMPPSPYDHYQQSQSQYESPTTPTTNDLIEIEVAPGEFLPLRGSQETLLAIEAGQSQKVSCLACGCLLTCINDCLMVICPVCRCISPTPHEHDTSTVWLRIPHESNPTTTTSSIPHNNNHNHNNATIPSPPFSSSLSMNDNNSSHTSNCWWEGDEEEECNSFLSGYAARHRQEVRRRATLSISTRPKRGVGLGLQVE